MSARSYVWPLLLGSLLPTPVSAQLCFNFLQQSNAPTLTCSEASYMVTGADGGFGSELFGDGDMGVLWSEYDWRKEFTSVSDPDSILGEFFARNATTVEMDENRQVTSIQVRQGGRIALTVRDSDAQEAQWGSGSRTSLIVDSLASPKPATVPVDIVCEYHLVLENTPGNDTEGVVFGGSGVSLTDAQDDELALFNGLAQLDLERSASPELQLDFDGAATVTASGVSDDAFEIEHDCGSGISLDRAPGSQFEMEVGNFGRAITNDFDPGDAGTWSSISDHTFTVTVSSDDPQVRFQLLGVPFLINPGLNDAWFNAETAGQGFFIIVFEDAGIVFLAWFTFDTERPPEDVKALLGEPGHRWVTAQGPYAGDTATLQVFNTEGGVFDMSEPMPVTGDPIGTITIVWSDCENGILTYEIDPPGVSGEIPIRRIVPDNVALCEALIEG